MSIVVDIIKFVEIDPIAQTIEISLRSKSKNVELSVKRPVSELAELDETVNSLRVYLEGLDT